MNRKVGGKWLSAALAALVCFCGARARAEALIVKEGEPRAQIVIAENPPRLVKLAAEELRENGMPL